MLLEYYPKTFTIPHTSACYIQNTGFIVDGDVVSITSPLFASIDFSSREFNMKTTVAVPVRVQNQYGVIEIPESTTGGTKATLVCDDNDIFNMYVRITE